LLRESGAQHPGSAKRFECGVYGALTKQFAQLQHLGVDAAQGNFFHPPMTGEKLLTLLLDNTTTY
ncbi:hypothetical protein, partial [Pseudomonas helleri]|uniref:hypothetical protein n=1 Tax=Pseudomonas helleri TaxID=1608996 RepID=UPI001E5D138D